MSSTTVSSVKASTNILLPFSKRASSLRASSCNRGFTTKLNKIGDIGSPCLTPLFYFNYSSAAVLEPGVTKTVFYFPYNLAVHPSESITAWCDTLCRMLCLYLKMLHIKFASFLVYDELGKCPAVKKAVIAFENPLCNVNPFTRASSIPLNTLASTLPNCNRPPS